MMQMARFLCAIFAHLKSREPKLGVAQNQTHGCSLAAPLTLALGSRQRRKGLLGQSSMQQGSGLWIAPCQAIHTFGMAFPIDLVYLDKRKRVRRTRSDVGPFRISVCLLAHSVLELPAGTVAATGTRVGDIVEIVHSQPLESSNTRP